MRWMIGEGREANTLVGNDRAVIELGAAARRPCRPLVAAVLLAVLLGLAELPFAAFMADDFIQLDELEGVSPCTWLGPLQLYTISGGRLRHIVLPPIGQEISL
jgi:hypothetical protein